MSQPRTDRHWPSRRGTAENHSDQGADGAGPWRCLRRQDGAFDRPSADPLHSVGRVPADCSSRRLDFPPQFSLAGPNGTLVIWIGEAGVRLYAAASQAEPGRTRLRWRLSCALTRPPGCAGP